MFKKYTKVNNRKQIILQKNVVNNSYINILQKNVVNNRLRL